MDCMKSPEQTAFLLNNTGYFYFLVFAVYFIHLYMSRHFSLFLVCIYSLTSYLLCNTESRFYCVLWIMCFTYTHADCNNNDPVLSLY